MIAAKSRPRKLAALLLTATLTACAPIPFGHPAAKPGFPIITSGVFALPDGAKLPYRLYPPANPAIPPAAIVLALHGYTDSRDGWQILSATLNASNIALYAPDQSSFGTTANRGLWPGTTTLVNEARDMATQLRAQYPHTKLIIMGESMGGAIALLLGASPNPPPVDAYIISAPAVWGGTALNPAYRVATALAKTFVPAKRVTGGSVHIQASDNIPALIAFGEDPLTIHEPRVDNVAGLVTLMGQAQAACAHFTQPAFILYGGHDQLIPAPAIKSCWKAIPATAPVTLAYYKPDYHLIERDLEREVPNDDILSYILGQGILSDAPSQATIFLAQ
jgi:alpha-beta hydrolase superfamily lysophospholipase